MAFGGNLALIRKCRGLTQEELAAKLGVTKSTISMYERGEREPNLTTLVALSDLLNVDVNQLLFDTSRIENAFSRGMLDEKTLQFLYVYFVAATPRDKRIIDAVLDLNDDGGRYPC